MSLTRNMGITFLESTLLLTYRENTVCHCAAPSVNPL